MPEDRDQLFEQALARHLRAGGAAESVCLDPEMLAAYHEHTLSPEEVASAKSHIVSCARCQQVLAALEVSETLDQAHDGEEADVPALLAAGVPSQVDRRPVSLESRSSATREASPRVVAIPAKKYFSWRWVAPAGAIAAGFLIWISARESRIIIKPSAPATQVADNRQQAVPRRDAENLKDSIPSEEQEKQKSGGALVDRLNERTPIAHATPAPQPSLHDEKKDSAVGGKLGSENNKPATRYEYSARAGTGLGGGRGPSAAAAQAQANNALQRGDQGVVGGAAQMVEASPVPSDLDKAELRKVAPPAKSGMVGAPPPAAPPPPIPSPTRLPGRLRGTVTDPSGAVVSGASVVLKSASGDTVVSTSTDTSGTYSFSGVAAGNYQLELQSTGFKTDRLTGLTVAAGENVMNARLELGTSTETVEVVAQPAVASSTSAQVAQLAEARERKAKNLETLLLLSGGLKTVTSPDGKAVWKFGEAGQIFHSTNAGKDWTSQASGVTVRLLAGSAPSAKVCWAAGASGTLLRTTDGGRHWRRITVPINSDLGGVHASGAKHASIWDAPNRLSYATSDGGATWTPSANE